MMKKRVVTVVICMAMILVMLPFSVFAEESALSEETEIVAEEILELPEDNIEAVEDIAASEGSVELSEAIVLEEEEKSTITGLVKEDGCWYYRTKDGSDYRGWKKIDGKWHYFDPEMLMNGWKYADGDTYPFDKNGALKTGLQKNEDGYWYYINAKDHSIYEGWKKFNGKWRYFGWQGQMVLNCWYDGVPFDKKGFLKTGWQKDGEGDWHYINKKDHSSAKGWKKISGKWYYFDEYGWMVTRDTVIKNKLYRFKKNGVWVPVKKGWSYADATHWQYGYADGSCAIGWKKLSGKWYYFGEGDGEMYTGLSWIYDDKKDVGNYYYFGDNGVMRTGWQYDGYDWFYCKGNGKAVTGWQKISGKWYYFDRIWMQTGWIKLYGKWYYFNENGVWVK